MKRLSKKRRQQLLIAALIITAAGLCFYIDYYHKSRAAQTEYQKYGEAAYKNIIKPEDTIPLMVPNEKVKNGRTVSVPILMYHHVGDLPPNADTIRRGLTISTQEFQTQVAWLKANGYTSVTLKDLYSFSQKQPVTWPKKPVIFTFDDGYADALENAAPILKQNGFTGVFAIITQFPGTVSGSNTYATWQQIADARQSGMEIVCHTQNHFDGSNPKYNTAYIYENLSGCQQDLQNHLGSTEPFLIYPYGHSTPAYIEQAKKAGFVMALTVHEGSLINLDSLMYLPRVRVNPNETLSLFQETVTGQFPHTSTSSLSLYGK